MQWRAFNNMPTKTICVAAVLGFALSALCAGQSPLPSRDMTAIAAMIQRDFGSVDEIRTIGMSDDPAGRFDIVVVGSRRGTEGGWRVEVLSVDHHELKKKWDSIISAAEPEFESSGPKAVSIHAKGYNYDVVIQGCVARNCGDGVDGFLIFSGGTGKTYKAKVVTEGLDKPVTAAPKYNVTFSTDISAEAKKALQDQMCQSSALSNKPGLPFECKNP